MVLKTKKYQPKTATVSFRINRDIKDKWEIFINKHQVDRKSTIELMLLKIMEEELSDESQRG